MSHLTSACLTCLSSVPEPSAWLLLTIGLVGLLGYGWQRRHDDSTLSRDSGAPVVLKCRQEGLHAVWLIECLERFEQGEGAFEEVSRCADVAHCPMEDGLGHQRLCHFVASSYLFQDA